MSLGRHGHRRRCWTRLNGEKPLSMRRGHPARGNKRSHSKCTGNRQERKEVRSPQHHARPTAPYILFLPQVGEAEVIEKKKPGGNRTVYVPNPVPVLAPNGLREARR